MNRKFYSACLLAVAFVGVAHGQPLLTYQNNDTVLVPPAIAPNIDAITFENRGKFIINFTNTGLIPFLPPPLGLPPYETQNTLNYSNILGRFMSCNAGFRFEHYDSQAGLRRQAATFFNAGTINSGTVETTNFLVTREGFFGTTNLYIASLAGSKLIVNATNIVNPGVINMGYEGLLTMRGKSLNFARGTLTMEPEGFGISSGANIGFYYNQGIFDGYWGVGDVRNQLGVFYPFGINPALFFGTPPPLTPSHQVTTRYQDILIQQLLLTNSVSYLLDELNLAESNRTVRAVFLANTNPSIQANVYFPFVPGIAVEFTNAAGTSTNNLYILDYFGVETNLQVEPLGFARGVSTFRPVNYEIFYNSTFFGTLFFGTPVAPTPIPPGTFNNTATTNQWAAYRALLQPLSVILEDTAGQDVTNIAGRIELNSETLDLTQSQISSLNYLAIRATNHFGGSSRARISSPYVDLHLRSTNGLLAITNLLTPIVNRPEGDIKLYSARWTNTTTVFGQIVTNQYHVLFIDANFALNAPSRLQEALLISTNTMGGSDQLVINDILTVTRKLTLDSERITISSNTLGSPIAAGGIYFVNPNTIWPGVTPRLKYLTNQGALVSGNTIFFGGSRTSPYFSTNFNEPYDTFINQGGVTNFSSLIWAKNFYNSGIFQASFADIDLQQAQTATLVNGAFLAGNGAISIGSGSLTVSNHLLLAPSGITLNVTNLLTDGYGNLGNQFGQIVAPDAPPNAGITNGNVWFTTGFNLLTKPRFGDLLATTISNSAPQFGNIINRWAGEDRGCSPLGFKDNGAIGRLILDGGANSQFSFEPVPLTLTFDQASTVAVPSNGFPVGPGIYRPTTYAPNYQLLTNWMPTNIRTLLAPPYGTNLAIFRSTNNSNPNGNWRLFIDRSTNNIGSQIDWSWTLSFGVLSSNFARVTNIVLVNGELLGTNVTTNITFSATYPTFDGEPLMLEQGVPPGGALANPYPAVLPVVLPLRSNQLANTQGWFTNRIGVNIFVTNRLQRVTTTDLITNVVVSLSAPSVAASSEVDVLLVGPQDQKVILMAGTGLLNTDRNAIYVDSLELWNDATVRDAAGNFVNLSVAPNMRVYFAQALANGAPVAEKLSGANGGRFCWVSDYAGAFSSTNVVYPDGNIYALNKALVESCTINSDPLLDDTVNCADPTPVFVASSLDLSVVVSPSPRPAAKVSWNSLPLSTNYVFYNEVTNPVSWKVLTNFVMGPVGGRVNVVDPTPASQGRFYRVRVDRH